jgi:hypothetical protein
MPEGGHCHISWLMLPGDYPLETADVSVPVAVSNTRLPASPSAHISLLGMRGGTVLRLQAENTVANLNSCVWGGRCHQTATGTFSYLFLQPHPTRGALKSA